MPSTRRQREPLAKQALAKPPSKEGASRARRADGQLVKMSVLAQLSGVPSATIKHYVREGLLPGPSLKGRNVAYYDRDLAGRIQQIKELQRSRFLPLKVIRDVLDGEALPSKDDTVGAAIARVLSHRPKGESRTEAELLASGMPRTELDWLASLGLIAPIERGGKVEPTFAGDDLELLRVLGAARRAGIGAEMLPVTVLSEYADAMRRLVRAELRLFREGVVPRAGSDLPTLAEAAKTLSERLVLLLRRKLLLPTLKALIREEAALETKAVEPKKKRPASAATPETKGRASSDPRPRRKT